MRDVDSNFSLIDGAVGASSRMIEGIWGDPIVVSFVHNSSLIKIKVIREIRFSVSLKEISYYLLIVKKMSRQDVGFLSGCYFFTF